MKEFEKLAGGNLDLDWEGLKPFYTNIAKDVDTQRKRIGGDFVIAHAITSQNLRDHIRLTLPDCIFVTLTLTKESQAKRIKARHGDDPGAVEFLANMFNFYEGPGEGEKNTFNVDITETMTPKDVKDKVLEILEKNCEDPKAPWKNGYYYTTKNTAQLQKIDGNTITVYNIIALDYPDVEPMASPGTITYGDFGPAREEVQNASGGVKNYNVEIKHLNGKLRSCKLLLKQ